jgi:hypothetical protein
MAVNVYPGDKLEWRGKIYTALRVVRDPEDGERVVYLADENGEAVKGHRPVRERNPRLRCVSLDGRVMEDEELLDDRPRGDRRLPAPDQGDEDLAEDEPAEVESAGEAEPAEDDDLAQLRHQFSGRSWCRVDYAWMRFGKLAADEALFLGVLVNVACGKRTVRREHHGRLYFLCTDGFLGKLGWTTYQQKRLLGQLVRRRLLRRKLLTTGNGYRTSRYLHIDVKALRELSPGGGVPPAAGHFPVGGKPPAGGTGNHPRRVRETARYL